MMTNDSSEELHHVVELAPAMNRCPHGHHLQAVKTEQCPEGWCVHEYHGCILCGSVQLACVEARPDEVRVVGRRIPVRRA